MSDCACCDTGMRSGGEAHDEWCRGPLRVQVLPCVRFGFEPGTEEARTKQAIKAERERCAMIAEHVVAALIRRIEDLDNPGDCGISAQDDAVQEAKLIGAKIREGE